VLIIVVVLFLPGGIVGTLSLKLRKQAPELPIDAETAQKPEAESERVALDE
jgi:hypothetical protein